MRILDLLVSNIDFIIVTGLIIMAIVCLFLSIDLSTQIVAGLIGYMSRSVIDKT